MYPELTIEEAEALLAEAESNLKRFHQETFGRILTDEEEIEYKQLVDAENAAHYAMRVAK